MFVPQEQESQGFPEFQTALRNSDFAVFGRLCGGEGAVVRDPAEVVIPPKVMTRFMLGHAVAKTKEMLGKSEREPGIEPLADPTPLTEDRRDD